MRRRRAGFFALLFGFSPSAFLRRARRLGKWSLIGLFLAVVFLQYAWAEWPWVVILVAVTLLSLAGMNLWGRLAQPRRLARAERGNVNRDAVYYRDGGRCYICGDPANARTWHLEHTIPICEGGADEYWNVGVSCADCNLRKGSADPRRDWRWRYLLDAIPRREERFYLIREYLQKVAA